MSVGGGPLANPVVVLREESDDWAILFNPDTGDAVGINPVGVAVWRLLDGTRGGDDIVAAITTQFDEVPDSARDDVEGFISDLGRCGFLVTEPGEALG